MEPMTLHTARAVLSTPSASDVAAIHAACQDADIQRYTTLPSPYLRAHAEEFVERSAARWRSGVETTWALRVEGALAGMIGLAHVAGGDAEIGYWMARGHRRRGLLTEAAIAVVDWGFDPGGLALERIEWRAVAGNRASARVAQKLGFRYEGTLRRALSNSLGRTDCWIAGMLPSDPRAASPWAVLGD